MINNFQAEQAVVGTVLMEGSLFDGLIVQPEHFYNTQLQTIFKAMQQVHEKEQAINTVSVTTELGEDIGNVGGVSHLVDLAQSIPSVEPLKDYEYMVLEAYRNRETRKLAMQYAENPDDESLEKMMGELETLKEIGTVNEEWSTFDYLQEIASELLAPPEESEKGFPTGFADFDNMTGGLQPSDLIIVAARPSVGKTAFALNIASGHCKNGGTSHVFSLEMGTKQLLQRMISAESRVDGQKWRSMKFSSKDYDRAMNAIGIIADWDLKIHENATTNNDIKAKIRKAVNDQPDSNHLVVIDYLQLMQVVGRYERRDLEVGAITRDLKLLAKELDIPIVLLSQLSRGVEQRQDKRPMMSDLRESGNIEQDADVIGFLYRDDYYDRESESKNVIEIILSKQRNGPTGTVEMSFMKEYGKFHSLAKWHEGAEQIG